MPTAQYYANITMLRENLNAIMMNPHKDIKIRHMHL